MIRFAVGKPKSTSGHAVPHYETSVVACEDHETWGGICFDGPVLTVYSAIDHWVVEHLVVHDGGSHDPLRNPGSFRETFADLTVAVDFVLRFYFRDQVTFNRLTKALC
ncbi:hypothetical protein [Aporhodopirellula aestuarii]|uniref:Uncharacterized protein n=1 Tax=Aporhodopirellula aestuarii TaxID=2950107 RepID=A0ABT0TXQ8_9BACT|nr:hypothetical protein [Aporhodopirellula aestuarii]MCM2369372.1 hypothetical protein [Aporhodopirellula aestuarii]